MGPIRTAGTVFLLLLTALASASPAAGAPSCAEGPQTEGEKIVGTPCNDTIRAPRGVTTVFGEGGDDTLYGQRGNDTLWGGEGSDRLYGGVGDDHLRGGSGNDHLSGGFGADSLDGEGGDDFDRGDATIDFIGDSGGGTDTISFATGVTPGFPNEGPTFDYAGFPSDGAEEGRGRGVYIELSNNFANDGRAPDGGGFDRPFPDADPSTEEEDFESFEKVVGTPFSDYIVGTSAAQTIYGGGGGDVILGKGGGDQVLGGADGDYCEAGAGITTTSCEHSGGDKAVAPHSPSAVGAGLMTGTAGPPALYLTGSEGADVVNAQYGSGTVSFELGAGADFDPGSVAEGGCNLATSTRVVCPVSQSPDSIVLAGLGGADHLTAVGFSESTSPILLGGDGVDVLSGGATEDALVDGSGGDTVSAGAGDDAVPNNEGKDTLHAGPGEDLFISDSVCEGDVLNGGSERDNANWANFDFSVAIDMGQGHAGLLGDDGHPDCDGNPLSTLSEIEDVEGTNEDDNLVGDPGPNQLLGREGADTYFAAGGNDSILANSGLDEVDPDPQIDCGEGFDTAQIDFPENGPDAAPVGCERVYERAPNSFRPPDTPPGPEQGPPTPPADPTPPVKPPRVRDRTPPRTTIAHHPARLVFTRGRMRTVIFTFGANEAGSSFRCKLDRDRFRPCSSPRPYRLRPGRHAIRVYAVDAAGNRDASPALFRFKIRRR